MMGMMILAEVYSVEGAPPNQGLHKGLTRPCAGTLCVDCGFVE